MMDAYSKPIAVLFNVIIIIVTADFIMNLILAVFCEAFNKEMQLQDKEKLEELEAENLYRKSVKVDGSILSIKSL